VVDEQTNKVTPFWVLPETQVATILRVWCYREGKDVREYYLGSESYFPNRLSTTTVDDLDLEEGDTMDILHESKMFLYLKRMK